MVKPPSWQHSDSYQTANVTMGLKIMHIQERRSTSRSPSSSKGYAVLNGIDLDLRTHDVSPTGALVELASSYSIREGMKLRIHLNACLVRRAVVCRVVSGNMLALKFENPIPEAATIH